MRLAKKTLSLRSIAYTNGWAQTQRPELLASGMTWRLAPPVQLSFLASRVNWRLAPLLAFGGAAE